MNVDEAVVRVRVSAFLARLPVEGFRGDIGSDEANRLVASVDNSLYQVVPAGVVFPKTGDDLNRLARLASADPAAPIAIAARGGGTGTNGQSLTSGVVVDTARHLNRILAFDPVARTVSVEPGVVLGQLNAVLAEHGLFFPPMVSTASRATLGGMVATDASGKGSRHYGKTSDWIEALDVVLADGSDLRIDRMDAARVDALVAGGGLAGRAVDQVRRTVTRHAAEIERVFPKLNRGLTGYNLQGATGPDGSLTLLRVVAGSEGTLALTKAIHLRVAPKPRLRALAVIRYDSFDATLCDVGRLLRADPLAVEVLDDKVVALARQDVLWSSLERSLGPDARKPVRGISFVEFVGDRPSEIADGLARLAAILDAETGPGLLDWTRVVDPDAIAGLWALREKAVGLMGKLAGERQGAAFVEDCAVPPDVLPQFVREFRSILDRHGLAYGMYGHADVGCLHVRPALDMRVAGDAAKIRPITDEVAHLAKRFGGLLWGEHGRGYRGEYSPLFFGETLYAEIRAIKAAFDPLNILNPGKLASGPAGQALDRIDAVPTRGDRDRLLDADHRRTFGRAIACNGNGACVSWDAKEVMCPSFKASRDRRQSPTGRAILLREWARRNAQTPSPRGARAFRAFEAEVHAALSTCLGCKACATLCPVQVDIPTLKARFLDRYHRTHRRRLRDRLVARFESILALGSRFPRLANAVGSSRPVVRALKAIGLVDLPLFSVRPLPFDRIDLAGLEALPDAEKRRTVLLVADTFTAAFDTAVPLAARAVLTQAGYRVLVAPAHPNGKALQVLGYLRRFGRVAARVQARHAAYLATGVHVIGTESVTLLMDRHEYPEASGLPAAAIRSLDEFLHAELESGRLVPKPPSTIARPPVRLFAHCTEGAIMPEASARWVAVMAAYGIAAEVVRTGCCGMAGLFGHQREHAATSVALFDMTWRAAVGDGARSVAATGFSCRCQTKRLAGHRPPHPVELLDGLVGA